MTKDYQVTEWSAPRIKIKTQYGHILYIDWLRLEMDRWFAKDCSLAWVQVKKETCHEGEKDDVAMFTEQRNVIELEDEG